MVLVGPSVQPTVVRGGYRADTKAVAVECDTRSHRPAHCSGICRPYRRQERLLGHSDRDAIIALLDTEVAG